MKLSWKHGVALVLGGILLGGSLSALGQNSDTPVEDLLEVQPAQQDDAEAGSDEGPKRGPGGPGHGGPGGRGMVRSEALVEGEEDGTFNTIRHDRGIVTAVDGNTITFEEADGRSVEVTANDDTRVVRDHEQASVSDIEVGDHVGVHRVREGEGDFVTKHIFAISEEEYAEMEAAREACTDDDQSTECERPMHRHHRGPGGPGRPGGFRGPGPDGAVEPAEEPANAA